MAKGFIHSNIKLKQSKAWDMCYHWIRDMDMWQLFRYYWARGCVNEVDYFTKHHLPNYHFEMRSIYILKGNHLTQALNKVCSKFFQKKKSLPNHSWQGCIGVTTIQDPQSPDFMYNRKVASAHNDTSYIKSLVDTQWRQKGD